MNGRDAASRRAQAASLQHASLELAIGVCPVVVGAFVTSGWMQLATAIAAGMIVAAIASCEVRAARLLRCK